MAWQKYKDQFQPMAMTSRCAEHWPPAGRCAKAEGLRRRSASLESGGSTKRSETPGGARSR
eukprot:5268662-Lingulodinium_polyedra.AAC.1